MEPGIKNLSEKKLVGRRMTMSFTGNKTGELWRSFMPRRREIKNNLTNEMFSLQLYGPSFSFSNFNPDATFEKWAAVEVSNFDNIPDGMETMILPGGLYAVFLHKGAAATGPKTFQYIFGTWLPGSIYLLDNRPHFEILGAKYKNDDPESEEEIWIPVKLK